MDSLLQIRMFISEMEFVDFPPPHPPTPQVLQSVMWWFDILVCLYLNYLIISEQHVDGEVTVN